MKFTVALYSHPELYPPTLNAINALARDGHTVDVVLNNTLSTVWKFAPNVRLFPTGALFSHQELEKKNVVVNFFRWLQFSFRLYLQLANCDVFLMYDPTPALSYRLFRLFLWNKPKVIWCHNHDVVVLDDTRKYSLNWLAAKAEQGIFQYLDFFTLPSEERKICFPLETFAGKTHVIPNYPSQSFFANFQAKQQPNTIKILYQGSIGIGHGIEEVIGLLPCVVNEKSLSLTLKGRIKDNYKAVLDGIAAAGNAQNDLKYVGITPYHEVPLTTQDCHIGIAVFTRSDIMNRSLGSASNKIYEYIACGLPILYYDDEHYNKYLGQYEWAVATDLSEASLKQAIAFIDQNYADLSAKAKKSFEDGLNFESYFLPVLKDVVALAKTRGAA
jgi:glycosyltransferase involved in cell wall biosynthesis